VEVVGPAEVAVGAVAAEQASYGMGGVVYPILVREKLLPINFPQGPRNR
jgi:hypothetical protein